jgi:hypothetical protein
MRRIAARRLERTHFPDSGEASGTAFLCASTALLLKWCVLAVELTGRESPEFRALMPGAEASCCLLKILGRWTGSKMSVS